MRSFCPQVGPAYALSSTRLADVGAVEIAEPDASAQRPCVSLPGLARLQRILDGQFDEFGVDRVAYPPHDLPLDRLVLAGGLITSR
jgi:hypothetical protein